MYVYKPMSGHNLMQAIARVNRVFKDKEGGLIVDYVGIASEMCIRDRTDEDIKKIADTYNAFVEGTLEDEKGFCAVVTTQDIACLLYTSRCV